MSKEQKNVAEEAAEGCCGGPVPERLDACCVADANAKAAGDNACGCRTPSESISKAASSCC